MKDLYRRLGIVPKASAAQIRDAISAPPPTAGAAAVEAAELVLLDPKRRKAYDRTHRVLTTIGDLRSHLGLNYKTFWARSKLRDFTYELAAPPSRRPRRTIRSLRPADIRRAFGLGRADPDSSYEHGRRRLLVIACLLMAMTVAAVSIVVYHAIAR